MGKKIKCPKWGCGGAGTPLKTNKKFSFGKAIGRNIVGEVLLGPAGAIAGTIMGVNEKDGKTTFVC